VTLGSPTPHLKKMTSVAALAATSGRTAALLLRAGALLLCAYGSAAQLNVPDAPTLVALDVLSGCACLFGKLLLLNTPRRALRTHAAPRRIISHAASYPTPLYCRSCRALAPSPFTFVSMLLML